MKHGCTIQNAALKMHELSVYPPSMMSYTIINMPYTSVPVELSFAMSAISLCLVYFDLLENDVTGVDC